MTHMPINPQIVTTQEILIAVIMITINVSSIALATQHGGSASSTIKYIFSSRIELGYEII